MSGDPEFDLEAALAADEAAIRDDGFSARVAGQAARSDYLRRFVIGGAALAGLGFAAGGLLEMQAYLPDLSGWWGQLMAGLRQADQDAGRALLSSDSSGEPLIWAMALAAGLLATVVAVGATRSR